MDAPPLLPVYLIHWNAPDWCAAAAASIRGSTDVDIDLTVIDNGRAGGEPLPATLLDVARVLPQTANHGYTGGANAAIDDWRARFPDGEFCVIGSHDLHVEPETLARLLDTARREETAGVVAPAIVSPIRRAGGCWNGRRAYQLALDGAPELVARDWASGTCLLLRRACVDAVGPFDERLGSYVEDVDYGLRTNDAGWKVLVVTSASAGGLGAASPNTIGHIAANTVLVNAKRRGVVGALDSLALFVAWILKGWVASLLPWRDRERRAVSRLYARQRVSALYRLLSTGRLTRVLAERKKTEVPAVASNIHAPQGHALKEWRARWRAALDRPGRYPLLAVLESAASSRTYRRPVWMTKRGPYWLIRSWRGTTVVSSTYQWRGPDFWPTLTADLLYYRYRPRPGDVVVDIGAGMGEELPSLSDAVSVAGRVIAIEAHPFTYDGLLRTISLNRLVNCEPVAAAISDQTGNVMMSDMADLDANTTVGRPAGEAQIEVAALTLDDLAERMSIDRIDLLKMNIEGAERLAIRGMTRTLTTTQHVVISCHDFLAAETGDASLETKALMISALRSAGFVVETREDDRTFVADYIYGTRETR